MVHGGLLVRPIVHADDADQRIVELESGVAGDDLRGQRDGDKEESASLH